MHASSLVTLAGTIRGTGWAKDVTAEQWEGFRRVIRETPAACKAAAALAPQDPTPWIVHLGAATGCSYPNDDFRALWAQVTARAPAHIKAHLAAMNY